MRLLLIAGLFVVGCASLEPKTTSEKTPLGPAEIRSAQAAAESISVGRSTKADVRAALGEGVVVDFKSGYEVWVYREPAKQRAKPPATELVLLFDPSGVLVRTRVR